jgi:hypothetical protein
VSNFGVKDLATLVASAKVKPAANQVRMNPPLAFPFVVLTRAPDPPAPLRLRAAGADHRVC